MAIIKWELVQNGNRPMDTNTKHVILEFENNCIFGFCEPKN